MIKLNKTDREILLEIEDIWEDLKDMPEMELSPKAVNWLIEKLKEYLGKSLDVELVKAERTTKIIEFIQSHDLDEMIDVVSDRALDYSEIREDAEESFKGEIETSADKFYKFGYGDTLNDTVQFLTELKKWSRLV